MNAHRKPALDLRPVFGDAIAKLLDGDMKAERNDAGWTFVEQLARDMFLSAEKAAKVTAIADARARGLPQLKAAVDRARELNAPKQALLDFAERTDPFDPQFLIDLPFCFSRLDTTCGDGTQLWLPTNRKYKPLGKPLRGTFYDYEEFADQAWHFRRNPREIAGAWARQQDFVWIEAEREYSRKARRAFHQLYLDRLRRILAEAIPRCGGLARIDWDWETPIEAA
jgi:hypothetical protein